MAVLATKGLRKAILALRNVLQDDLIGKVEVSGKSRINHGRVLGFNYQV